MHTRLVGTIRAIAEIIVELSSAEFLGSVFTSYHLRRFVVFLIWASIPTKSSNILFFRQKVCIKTHKKGKEIGKLGGPSGAIPRNWFWGEEAADLTIDSDTTHKTHSTVAMKLILNFIFDLLLRNSDWVAIGFLPHTRPERLLVWRFQL